MISQTSNSTTHDHASFVTRDVVNDAIVTAGQPENIQTMQCEVCNVSCNSADVLEKHKQGKKHLKNLQTLAQATVIAPKMPPPPVAAAASATLDEELENKKQNVTQDGGSVDTLLKCDICNVVCINQDVFRTHVAGKKHSAKASVVTRDVVNDAIVTAGQPENIQTMQCEVCNVSCNSADVLEKHKQGKKHLKNLQTLAQATVIAPKMPPPPVAAAASATLDEELENKKQNVTQDGGSVDTLLKCDICNVVCINQDVFRTHVAGKKHSAKAIMQLLGANGLFTPTLEGNSKAQSSGVSQKKPDTLQCELCNISCTSNELLKMHLLGKKHQRKHKESGLTPESIDGKSMECELCGISCTSYELLKEHLTGKKHLKNLEKSEKPIGPNPAPITQPASTSKEEGGIIKLDGSNRKAKRAGIHEDLETKKQKVLQGGAASDALRTCTVCSVVCNSPSVFFSHLAGQKHAAMALKKQAEVGSTVKET